MKLSEAEIGRQLKITTVRGEVRARLESMGIVAGQFAQIMRFAPGNGALLVRVNGIYVIIRKEIAGDVEVELA